MGIQNRFIKVPWSLKSREDGCVDREYLGGWDFRDYVESKGEYVNFVFNDDISSYPPGFCIHLDDHGLFSSRDDCIRLLLLASSDVIFGCECGACDNVIGCDRHVNE